MDIDCNETTRRTNESEQTPPDALKK
ncbi:TPA: hypothetical protein ANIA_11320 [Aspergillus nidulans FGSC A4]|uniref:Uncharacterized protein n=1 Tax=Emericella nidulans (strain FGSC A4 / ATCC 38163 / CBS 112.46 / NRRL 194 / M139) TaxID=227321 RepID=C8VL59_EMENI|nr:TPA: hypothetical protein ANIA_11320 [Aspergillus nidulans FGSC A4]